MLENLITYSKSSFHAVLVIPVQDLWAYPESSNHCLKMPKKILNSFSASETGRNLLDSFFNFK
jgi:hypothetical protein